MTNIRRGILEAAINHYGAEHQKAKAIEELCELARALAREDAENITEEMADVRVMLDQLEIIYDNHNSVVAMEYKKLQRLRARMIAEADHERRGK